jgi:hypothetical protein
VIDEIDGRWFNVLPSRQRERCNVYGEQLPDRTPIHKRAIAGTKQAHSYAKRFKHWFEDSWLRTAIQRLWALAQIGSLREMNPAAAITSIFVFGFAFILLTASVLSPQVRRTIATTPLIAAVSQPIADVLPDISSDDSSSDSSDSADLSGATDGIPANVTTLYESAARTCNMPWEVLAGVGRVETNHGQSDAPGVHSGANYAGAEGPMQFEPSTWAKYGIDADHDGKADIYDQTDAVYSAANYLCANGARNNKDMHNALYHYNHDDNYVNEVLSVASQYTNDAYVIPVSDSDAASLTFTKPHHDYPADDIPMPVGTQVYAVRGGTAHVSSNSSCGNELQIDGTDGNVYTYCHASNIQVSDGDTVNTGDPVLKSGGLAGAAGAGDSTGPHLHLQITVHGTNVCPQGLLTDWQQGQFESPANAPTSGCTD